MAKLVAFVANNFIALFLGVCLIELVIVAGYWNWDFWGEATYHDGKLIELKVDRGRIIQQSLIVLGGIVALFLAIWRTWTAKMQADASLQQVTIAQKGQNRRSDMLKLSKCYQVVARPYDVRDCWH